VGQRELERWGERCGEQLVVQLGLLVQLELVVQLDVVVRIELQRRLVMREFVRQLV